MALVYVIETDIVYSHDFLDVMDMLDRRMNDRGKMWRHVYKV